MRNCVKWTAKWQVTCTCSRVGICICIWWIGRCQVARIVMLVLCTIMLNLFLFLLFLLSFMALLRSTINNDNKQTNDPPLVLLSFLAKRRYFQLLNTDTTIHTHTHRHRRLWLGNWLSEAYRNYSKLMKIFPLQFAAQQLQICHRIAYLF